MADRRDGERVERPDVEIRAAVKAKKLRFERVPETDVRFFGDPPPETESGSERENLPNEVAAGRTYRDVRVRWRAAARMRVEPPEER
jgi:hypothetical protein